MRKLVMIPGPTNISERVMSAMLNPTINHRSIEFADLYGTIKEKLQQVFQTSNEIVVMSGSGTVAIDASVSSTVTRGDVVVVPAYGEFSTRFGESAVRTGATIITPHSALGTVPSIDDVEHAMKSSGQNASALCVVYNETSTGVTWRRLKELKELAAKYEALLIVDAISILGGDELPVDRLGIDICVTGSQKCLAAPAGLAILSVSDKAKQKMKSIEARSQYLDLIQYFESAKIGQMPYTPALPLFYALDEALDKVLEEGMERRILRHSICSEAFYAAFESLGLTSLAGKEDRSHTVIGILYPNEIDDQKFRTLLSDRFGVLVAGGFGAMSKRMFRIGCMGEINEAIVTMTIGGIANALKICGYDCDPSRALLAAWEVLAKLNQP